MPYRSNAQSNEDYKQGYRRDSHQQDGYQNGYQNNYQQSHQQSQRPYRTNGYQQQGSDYQHNNYQRSDYQHNDYQRGDYQRSEYQRNGYQRNNYGQRGDYSQTRPGHYGDNTHAGSASGGYDRPNRDYNRQGNDYDRQRRDFDRQGNDYERPNRDYNRQGNDYDRQRRDFDRQGNDYDRQRRDYNRQGRPQGNSMQRKKGPAKNIKRPVQPYYEPQPVDPNKPVRLNKYLANAGICSRREADEFIQAGVVTINGEVATMLGTKVYPTDIIRFHDQPIRSERKVYLLLNKPKDCVTTAEDTHARKTVLDVVKNACLERIYPVGRLDRNTTGVLLLTNDGDLAAKLTHPKYEKKKIYHATLDRPLQSEDYEKLMAGVTLENGDFVKADVIEITDENDPAHIGIEIHSGQNRVVRRMFDAVGYKVLRLDRVYFAGLTKKRLPRGKYRFLTPQEVSMLQMGAYE
ncbi:MAG: RNA-binding S4 domain-containing protein [Paludibacteraceae bacterium]|nr:RNA-binding S4 domain-containing protein [Paludibacteraceae bacterium]